MRSLDKAAVRRRRRAVTTVVVIPFYNGSAFIERSAQSVLDQTVPPTEFVVVDDGSRPEEAAKLDAIAARMGFRVLHKENGGQGSARNAGVAATSAEFICFLDQDDFYLETHIETLIDTLPRNDPHLGWVYGELMEADAQGNIVRTAIAASHSDHPKTSIFNMIGHDMHVLPSASMIRRRAFEAVGGFDPQFMGYEDDDLFMRIFRAGFTNYFTHTPVTVWCIHVESTSYGVRMARSRFRYFKKLVATFPDEEQKDRLYLKDIMIQRFYSPIIAEGVAAASDKPGKFTAFKEEYIAIAQEFYAVIAANKHVPWLLKVRTRFIVYLLTSRRLKFLLRLKPVARYVLLQLKKRAARRY